MSFHVGQKVVCISDDWFHPDLPLPTTLFAMPKKNRVYHVMRVRPFPGGQHLNSDYLELTEIANDVTFASVNFRPIIERKTDISIFTSLLDPSRKKEPERV